MKAQVDAIVDELAKVPEVAECYEQWLSLIHILLGLRNLFFHSAFYELQIDQT